VPWQGPWRWSPILATVATGVAWGLWHLPSFFVAGLTQHNCNLGMFVVQEVLYSVFYAWQANATAHSITAALLMHASINVRSWLATPFLSMPAPSTRVSELEHLPDGTFRTTVDGFH
jgi:membrane protease YdiL (CAAX protease family)